MLCTNNDMIFTQLYATSGLRITHSRWRFSHDVNKTTRVYAIKVLVGIVRSLHQSRTTRYYCITPIDMKLK